MWWMMARKLGLCGEGMLQVCEVSTVRHVQAGVGRCWRRAGQGVCRGKGLGVKICGEEGAPGFVQHVQVECMPGSC